MRLIFASQVPNMNRYSLVLIPRTEHYGLGTRQGMVYIEVSRSLIFAVGNESAKTAKIKRLENLALYGITTMLPT